MGNMVASNALEAGAAVIIVGGGVTGLAAGWWLSKHGVSALVLETGLIGWEASGRNGGGCSHHYSPLFAEEQRLWPLLDDMLGYPTEFRPKRIRIALNEQQLELYSKVIGNARRYGLAVDRLDPAQVRELVPLAGETACGGFYWHFGGHANPHRTVQAYAWALQDLGGRILEYTTVTGFQRHGGRVGACSDAITSSSPRDLRRDDWLHFWTFTSPCARHGRR
jgi:sarcosine oxidase, subunit beta